MTLTRRLTMIAAVAAALPLALALSGCAASSRVAVSDPQLQGTWHLASASNHGLGIPLAGNSITLRIGDARHTGGDSPCSSYSATVTGGVGVVYIRAQLDGGTRDDCATAQLNSLEKNYLDALTATRYAQVDEGSLVLSSPQSYLVFVKAAAAPVVALLNSNWRLFALPAQFASETV